MQTLEYTHSPVCVHRFPKQSPVFPPTHFEVNFRTLAQLEVHCSSKVQLLWELGLFVAAMSLFFSEGIHSEHITEQDIAEATLPASVRRCYLQNCSGIFLLSICVLHQKDTLVASKTLLV